MSFHTCDTKNIRVLDSAREFKTIKGLISSGRASEAEIEMTGIPFRVWWRSLTVSFPDRQHSSSACVEVVGKNINVGNPNNYVSFIADTYVSALEIAEKVNEAWLAFVGSEDDFVNQLDWDQFCNKILTNDILSNI